MDSLPSEVFLRILSMLDYRHLANAAQVSKSWSSQSGEGQLWRRLYEQRWGQSTFDPKRFKSWKAAYEAEDRCERVGIDVNITREGLDYFLVHEGRILRFLGTCGTQRQALDDRACRKETVCIETSLNSQAKSSSSSAGLVNKLLFFLGDLEYVTREKKRIRVS
ncbi:hypothetical protein KP509_20G092400 [Ceratopteris richardii]|uniref:F-box domain-containing protein n=1 Tax=Ceratopteris richardii TaxID=49495 RepID=A0A8T2SJ64_CERRI|nr:hypothetical protein KP509_20G092400 [Ceratopteris richardii]KAH7332523.1 hypothetical protein KP509_20G092400 [Ceratopteris richardii]